MKNSNLLGEDHFTNRVNTYDNLSWVRDQKLLGILKDYIPESYYDLKIALDVGIGTGACLPILLELGYRIIGLDISLPMLKKCEDRIIESNMKYKKNDIFLIQCDAHSIPIINESIDIIIYRNSLHHFRKPELSLRESIRVLKNGGSLIIIESVAPSYRSKKIWKKSLRMKDEGRNMNFTFCYIELFRQLQKMCLNIVDSQMVRRKFSVSNWLEGGNVAEFVKTEVFSLFHNANELFKREMEYEVRGNDIYLNRYWGIFNIKK